MDVILSKFDVVRTDVVGVLDEKSSSVTERNIQRPPTLVDEIVSASTSSRDRKSKQSCHESTGVQEYWVIDPVATQAEQFALAGDERYQLLISGHEQISSRACHSVKVDLTNVW